MSLYTEITPTQSREQWARFFGHMIRTNREKKGSIAKIAARAGMTVEEWKALEEGQIPTTVEQLQAIATALDKEWRGMVALVGFCRDAWER